MATYKKLTYNGTKTLCDMTNNFKVKTGSSETSTKYISNMFVKRYWVTVVNPTVDHDYEFNFTCNEFSYGDGSSAVGSYDCWRCFANFVGASIDGAFCTFFNAHAIHSGATNLKIWLDCLTSLTGTWTFIVDVFCIKCSTYNN